ncbi:MAG: hydantoinase B/oxoprolinase family protein [Hyphomicrobiaceae bacterium]
MTNVDPIALSVLWNGLIGVSEEMGSTLRRTAFSEAVRDGDDFSTALFDRHGRLLSQGNFTPGHLGSMPYIMKSVMQYFPADTLRKGDAILGNDSEIGSGHYPDFFMVSPVFRDGEIVAYAVNIAHHCDVGGAVPGSQAIQGITEAFQEGLRLLPVKVVQEGEFNQDVMRIILGNVRIPEKVGGDIRAQWNANYVGGERVNKLMDAFGRERFEAGSEAILDISEKRMRELIGAIPDGTYSFDDAMDDSGPGTPPIPVCVDVIIEGDELTVDFSRSGDQVAAGMNCYINYTRAYAMFAMKVLSDALLPQNDGVTRPIKIISRKGSFFNPHFPAPSGGRAANQVRIFEVINGALAKALPGKAMGAFSHWANVNIGGTDERTGRPFVFYDVLFGGYGGRSNKDGVDALAPIMNCPNIPIEIQEAANPVLVRRCELIQDSSGAGKYRGGSGLRKDFELRTAEATLCPITDRHASQPYGIFGGKPGGLAETVVNPDSSATRIGSKEIRKLKRGDVVSFRLAGAGGYGDPTERARTAIEADLRNGHISAETARAVYGFDHAEEVVNPGS